MWSNMWLIVLLSTIITACGTNGNLIHEEEMVKHPIEEEFIDSTPDSEEADAGETEPEEVDVDEPEEVFEGFPYEVQSWIEQLESPWALDIAADGTIYFTESTGAVRVIEDGELVQEPVISFPNTVTRSEGGLLGLALHPQFEHNRLMYVYQTYSESGTTRNRVLRLIENEGKAELERVIIDNLPGAANHNGGRIKIGPDEHLYITAGDIYEVELAQQLDSLGGKIIRLGLDGEIPDDNPFDNSPVYSWGHRNPQGLAWHPETGDLFSSEHGQTAHDEINLIIPGQNYGWPIIEGDQEADGMQSPLVHSSTVTWAPSGATFITKGPWTGDLFVANLRGEQLIRIMLDQQNGQLEYTDREYLFHGEFGRIRDVVEGPDGIVYILTNNRDGRGDPTSEDDRIIRLVPKFGK